MCNHIAARILCNRTNIQITAHSQLMKKHLASQSESQNMFESYWQILCHFLNL